MIDFGGNIGVVEMGRVRAAGSISPGILNRAMRPFQRDFWWVSRSHENAQRQTSPATKFGDGIDESCVAIDDDEGRGLL